MNKNELEEIFRNSNYNDFKWINSDEIIVAPWVRMKCQFGCSSYGKSASCPPNTPSTNECSDFFKSYSKAVIFRFLGKEPLSDKRKEWTWKLNKQLLELEKKVFLAGFHKTFLLFTDSCSACAKCTPKREDCKQAELSRPSPEGMSVDVFETVRKVGYEINVLTNYEEEMSRFAFLLIE